MVHKANGNRSAIYSDCGKYRYALRVELGGTHRGDVQFIGLNPSTATESQDDPTLRRCIGFARRWGFSAMAMTNLAAIRETDPRKAFAHPDPIGPENTPGWLAACAAKLVVAAWGGSLPKSMHAQRDAVIEAFAGRLHALGFTKSGDPRHPLYLRADTKPETWVSATSGEGC